MDNLFKTDALTEEVRLVDDLLQETLKAKKQIRMYPSNNPLYIKASETLYDKFTKFIGINKKLILKIHQNEIIYKKERVYYNTDKDDNLALFFFKDGVREVAFLSGLTQKELEDFIKILNIDFEADAPDDDIVTLLWDKNFEHIKYIIDENFLSNWEIPEHGKISDAAIKTAYQDGLKAERTQSTIQTKITVDIDIADLKYIAGEIERQNQPKLNKIITILFELLYQAKESANLKEIVNVIESIINYCIKRGDFKNASHVLDEVKTAIESKTSKEEVKILNSIYTAINSKELIEQIGNTLQSEILIDENEFLTFIKHLNESAIPSFMHLMGKMENIKNRKLLIEALTIFGRLNIKTLSNGLQDSNWHVVRNTALVLGKIATTDCIRYLAETLSHPDQRIRRETVRSIGNIKSPETLQYLKNVINDSVQSIRIGAARAIGSVKTEDAKKLLLSELSKKDFCAKDFAEKKEFYETLAYWQDKEVKDFLVKTLNKKSFWKRTRNDETRACAAHALGIINAKDSIQLLEKTSRSKNKLLRELSSNAIKILTSA